MASRAKGRGVACREAMLIVVFPAVRNVEVSAPLNRHCSSANIEIGDTKLVFAIKIDVYRTSW